MRKACKQELVVLMKHLARYSLRPPVYQREKCARGTVCGIQLSLDDACKSAALLASVTLHFSPFPWLTVPFLFIQSPDTMWYTQLGFQNSQLQLSANLIANLKI